jgi:hypothetical protein
MSSHTENRTPAGDDDEPIGQTTRAVDAKRSWSAPTITTFTVAADTGASTATNLGDGLNNNSEVG